MTKTCEICRKVFEAKTIKARLCSPECKREHKNKYMREVYIRPHKPHYEPVIINCGICGKPLDKAIYGRRRYHEECIIQEAVTDYKNGYRLPWYSLVRATNQGYSMTEIKEIAEASEE